MLGALSNGLPDISSGIWETAIAECVKSSFIQSNISAFKQAERLDLLL